MTKLKMHSYIIFVLIIIGNALIFIFISLVAFLGLFFYPFKKLSEKFKNKKKKKMDENENKD